MVPQGSRTGWMSRSESIQARHSILIHDSLFGTCLRLHTVPKRGCFNLEVKGCQLGLDIVSRRSDTVSRRNIAIVSTGVRLSYCIVYMWQKRDTGRCPCGVNAHLVEQRSDPVQSHESYSTTLLFLRLTIYIRYVYRCYVFTSLV